jgi:hypothetical protein
MKTHAIGNYIAHAGLLPALRFGFFKSINKVVDFTALKGMTLQVEDIPEGFLDSDVEYDCGFLDARTLYRLSENPEHEISREFLDWALGRGDRCYGFVDGNRLAAYGWYSVLPTIIMRGLSLHFDSDYVYMYKGFTHPSFRGQRLHGIGMAKAADAYTREGKKGLISYVEAHNNPSLRSCARLGYRIFGTIWIVGRQGHYMTLRTPNCRTYEFAVGPA